MGKGPLRVKDMSHDETCGISVDIAEIVANGLKAKAVGENVLESPIIPAAIAMLVYRYTGREKISLHVKAADSAATIEIDASNAFETAGCLLAQFNLHLKEFFGLSSCMSGMTIELPVDLMRPIMRSSICESADSRGMIIFQCEAVGGRFFCKFLYSERYYSADLVRQMARHFKNILSDMTERPNARIQDIRMLDEDEKKAILERGAGPKVETGEKCAHHFFEEQAAKNPKATALICGNKRMSFEELNSRANVIGHYLQSLGAGVGTVVGIGMERSIEAVVCIIATFKTGAAYVIVDPLYPAARVKEMLSDAQVSLLITNPPIHFDSEGLSVIDYAHFADRPEESTVNVVSDVTINDVAYITFTSGSTGKPKGIAGMHVSIATLLYYSRFFYKEDASDEVSALLSPLSFGASVGTMFMPLCNGIPLVVIPYGEEKDPYKFACLVFEHRITAFIMTTALARQLCGLSDEGKKLLQSVKHAGIGGSEVTPDLLRAVKRIMPDITITAGYAFSEIGTAAIDRFIEESDLKLEESERIPLGIPGPNTRTYILDRDMNIVPVGVPGELYVSAPYLSSGYVGMPDLTARRFLPNPFTDSAGFARMYRTGDVARRRFDGELEYIGRADGEVKIRGFRIEIEEIESVLRNHAGIVEAVVTVDKGKYSERLVAWVVRKPESEADIPELRMHIKKSLPDYMVPSIFIFTRQLPLNANGKIDRAVLSFDAAEHAVGTGDYKGPRNQVESAVAEIWASILERERIDVHDDFLDLGGDSIQAGLISLEIRDRFNVEILVIMFFEGMTVASLSEEIRHIQENSV